MNKLSIAVKVAWAFVGKFYKWGGDDPSGFDCSGLCIEILKSTGHLPRKGDWTAQSLFNEFRDNTVFNATTGCLVFWGWPKITHVEFCIDGELTIGASGGGSKTITEADAIKQNAYVKVRPIRKGYSKIVNPFI